jgi:hypothetical protein
MSFRGIGFHVHDVGVQHWGIIVGGFGARLESCQLVEVQPGVILLGKTANTLNLMGVETRTGNEAKYRDFLFDLFHSSERVS